MYEMYGYIWNIKHIWREKSMLEILGSDWPMQDPVLSSDWPILKDKFKANLSMHSILEDSVFSLFAVFLCFNEIVLYASRNYVSESGLSQYP